MIGIVASMAFELVIEVDRLKKACIMFCKILLGVSVFYF